MSGQHQERAPGPGLRGRRAFVVNALLLAILVPELAAIATNRECWPFSPYPMFSGLQGRTLTLSGVFGVTEDGEVPLYEGRYWEPFDTARLQRAVSRLAAAPGGTRRADAALRYLLDLYRRRRAAGAHDGSAIRGVRLYESSWGLDPDLANVGRPDARRLLFELLEDEP